MVNKLRSDTTIKSDRLWLRQIDETDAEAIVSLRSEEDVYKYFLNPVRLTLDDHKKWYKNRYCRDKDRIDWIAVNNENGAFVGVYGAKRELDNAVEVSYITNPLYRSEGYASEAVNSIIQWCMEHWGIGEAVAVIHRENKASICFAENNGFHEKARHDDFITMSKAL